jgi:hypothetical protein
MTIALARTYAGITATTVVKLPSSIESALVAQGWAATSAAALTTGNQTWNLSQGTVSVAIGAASVTVTNSMVDANSKVFAVVAQAAADGTFLRVERIVCAAGSFTIYGTATATAATTVDWSILNPDGMTKLN